MYLKLLNSSVFTCFAYPVCSALKRGNLFLLASIFLLLVLCTGTNAQENWSRFHGPNGTGLALEAELPSEISESDFLWNVDLAGTGSSSPVVWGERLFVNSSDSESGKLTVQCLNAKTGEKNWAESFDSDIYKIHNRNSFASGTPVVDKDHVYLAYAHPDQIIVRALTHDGEKKWERALGTWVSSHGFAASLMTYQDKLILFNSQQAKKLPEGATPGTSNMIALSCKDGTDVWKTPRTPNRCSYSVPGIFTDKTGQDHLIGCNTRDGFFSLDPETGNENWSAMPFRMRTVASILIADGLIVGSSGSGGGGNYLVAIRPDDKGANPEEVYQLQKANYVPSPVAVDGKLFFFTDKGIGRCVDLQTGDLHWQERLARGFSGSPVATKSHVYVMSESGELFVIAADSKYKLASSISLGEDSRSTPAIAGGRLYLRTDSRLICVGEKE